MKLFFINKYNLWFHTSAKLKGEVINKDTIKLARQIMKNLFKENKKPDLSKINLSLDKKVAIIEKSKTTEFEYWIKLSTLESGKPISIPLKSNKYFESIQGEIKNFFQFLLFIYIRFDCKRL